jgi:hypothetical protein
MKTISLFYIILVLGITSIMASQRYDDLAKLVKSGANEDVIIAFIDASDSSFNLSADEVVQLSKYGASRHVLIAAMKHKVTIASDSSSQPAPNETTSVAPPPRYMVYRVAPPWRPWRAARNYWLSPNIAKMNQAFQVDIGGFMFGALSLNYEYLFKHQHGIVLEGSYYPGFSTWDFHGENAELAYRWHWAKSMSSGFLGAFISAGRFYGHYHDFQADYDAKYSQTSITVGPNIGKRWVSAWGLSLVGRIGYGYTWSKFDNPAPDHRTMDRLRSESGLDAELSLGYAF